MVFSNKKTAAEVRKEAEKQLAEWIGEMFITVRDVAGKTFVELSDTTLHAHAQDQIRKMPPLVATLLFKSGMIYPNTANDDEDAHYPVTLFYDNDDESKVGDAMFNTQSTLVGGMVKGRIHT